jgi:hypothetical protein
MPGLLVPSVTPTPAVQTGSITLISETVASAVSGLSLSSIPSTYKNLVLTWQGIFPSAAATSGFFMRFNNNSTADTYKGTLTNNRSTATGTVGFSWTDATIATNEGSAPFGWYANTATGDLRRNATGSLTIYNYASTSKFKYYETLFGFSDQNGTQFQYRVLGNFCSTSAISSIDIVRDTGSATFSNASNTSIRLYGVL